MTFDFEEEERQAILLALAKLSLERPGWDNFLTGIALKMDTPENFKRRQVEAMRHPGLPHVESGKPVMFERFKVYSGS